MERGCLYFLVSFVFATAISSVLGVWYPKLFIFSLITMTGVLFFTIVVGCMGNYTVRLVDKEDDIQTE